MMGWWYGPDGGALGWVGMAIFMGLIVALIVVVVWSVVRVTGESQGFRSDTSLGILRERFARGEISQAEFEEAKRVLGLKSLSSSGQQRRFARRSWEASGLPFWFVWASPQWRVRSCGTFGHAKGPLDLQVA